MDRVHSTRVDSSVKVNVQVTDRDCTAKAISNSRTGNIKQIDNTLGDWPVFAKCIARLILPY